MNTAVVWNIGETDYMNILKTPFLKLLNIHDYLWVCWTKQGNSTDSFINPD